MQNKWANIFGYLLEWCEIPHNGLVGVELLVAIYHESETVLLRFDIDPSYRMQFLTLNHYLLDITQNLLSNYELFENYHTPLTMGRNRLYSTPDALTPTNGQ